MNSRSEKLIQAILQQKEYAETNEENEENDSNKTGSESFYKNEVLDHKDLKGHERMPEEAKRDQKTFRKMNTLNARYLMEDKIMDMRTDKNHTARRLTQGM